MVGGAAGETHCSKIADMMGMSLKTGSPFVFINDSGGARVQEGIDSLDGYARVFYNNVMLSGTVPQIAVICGPCAGGAAYSPALTDFVIQTQQARMFITGPQVIKQVTGEDVSAEELGGPQSQMNRSGVVHLVAQDDSEALALCRRLLSFMPSNNLEDPPRMPFNSRLKSDSDMNTLLPVDPKIAYDVREIVKRVVDYQDFLEIQPGFAANIVIGFGRLQGRPVGIVANQPSVMAGVLDIDASDKSARFVRFCNAFNIPLVTFVDVPGFLARRGAGAWRHYSSRRQAAVCIFGRHGSQDHGGAAQGLWRSLHRHVFQGPGRGPRDCMAYGGDCGHGRRGCSRNRLPP